MLLNILTTSFVTLSVLFTITFTLVAFPKVQQKLSPLNASAFVSSVVGLLFFYVINAVLLAIFVQDITTKLFFLCFALAPFVIGKYASYRQLKFYSVLQILCVIISCVYVLII